MKVDAITPSLLCETGQSNTLYDEVQCRNPITEERTPSPNRHRCKPPFVQTKPNTINCEEPEIMPKASSSNIHRMTSEPSSIVVPNEFSTKPNVEMDKKHSKENIVAETVYCSASPISSDIEIPPLNEVHKSHCRPQSHKTPAESKRVSDCAPQTSSDDDDGQPKRYPREHNRSIHKLPSDISSIVVPSPFNGDEPKKCSRDHNRAIHKSPSKISRIVVPSSLYDDRPKRFARGHNRSMHKSPSKISSIVAPSSLNDAQPKRFVRDHNRSMKITEHKRFTAPTHMKESCSSNFDEPPCEVGSITVCNPLYEGIKSHKDVPKESKKPRHSCNSSQYDELNEECEKPITESFNFDPSEEEIRLARPAAKQSQYRYPTELSSMICTCVSDDELPKLKPRFRSIPCPVYERQKREREEESSFLKPVLRSSIRTSAACSCSKRQSAELSGLPAIHSKRQSAEAGNGNLLNVGSRISNVLVPNKFYSDFQKEKAQKRISQNSQKFESRSVSRCASSTECDGKTNAFFDELHANKMKSKPSSRSSKCSKSMSETSGFPADNCKMLTAGSSVIVPNPMYKEMQGTKCIAKMNISSSIVVPNQMYGEIVKEKSIEKTKPAKPSSSRLQNLSSITQQSVASDDGVLIETTQYAPPSRRNSVQASQCPLNPNLQCECPKPSQYQLPKSSLPQNQNCSSAETNQLPSQDPITETTEPPRQGPCTETNQLPRQDTKGLQQQRVLNEPTHIPNLTPLSRPNIIEELKRELLTAFNQNATNCRPLSQDCCCLCSTKFENNFCGRISPNNSCPNTNNQCIMMSYPSCAPARALCRNDYKSTSKEKKCLAIKSGYDLCAPDGEIQDRHGLGLPGMCDPSALCSTEKEYSKKFINPCSPDANERNGFGLPDMCDPCCPQEPSGRSRSPTRAILPARDCCDTCSRGRSISPKRNGSGPCPLDRSPSPSRSPCRSPPCRSPQRRASPSRNSYATCPQVKTASPANSCCTPYKPCEPCRLEPLDEASQDCGGSCRRVRTYSPTRNGLAQCPPSRAASPCRSPCCSPQRRASPMLICYNTCPPEPEMTYDCCDTCELEPTTDTNDCYDTCSPERIASPCRSEYCLCSSSSQTKIGCDSHSNSPAHSRTASPNRNAGRSRSKMAMTVPRRYGLDHPPPSQKKTSRQQSPTGSQQSLNVSTCTEHETNVDPCECGPDEASEEPQHDGIVDNILGGNTNNTCDAFVQSSFPCCCCCCCCCRCCGGGTCTKTECQQNKKSEHVSETTSCEEEDWHSNASDSRSTKETASTIFQNKIKSYSSESLLATECDSQHDVIKYPSAIQRMVQNKHATKTDQQLSQVRIIVSNEILRPGASGGDVSIRESRKRNKDHCRTDEAYKDDVYEQSSYHKLNPDSEGYCEIDVSDEDVDEDSPTQIPSLSSASAYKFREKPDTESDISTECSEHNSSIKLPNPQNKTNSGKCCIYCCRCSYPKVPTAVDFEDQVAARAAAPSSFCKCSRQLETSSFRSSNSSQNSDFNYPSNAKAIRRNPEPKAACKMSSTTEPEESSVRVAVRVRPQNPREVIDMCRICTTVTPGEPQVVLGQDKAFTFDYVFDINLGQCEIYAACVERLVEGALRGYNATVLAYGQTGSGKTYTMGTGFEHDLEEQQQGIIPRAVRHIFSGIEEMQTREFDDNGQPNAGNIQFSVAAQFMELYNEDIVDLLDPYNKGRQYKIHEDGTGQITVHGATIKPICGPQEALKCLQQGALARTTASTQMNDQSSRSHALFTILIRRQRVLLAEESGMAEDDLETLTSKFHFVDLAGSERLKRTGATGERAREGISINCGLLSLGNCISALGDKSKRATHVPYRDSKLTRLLQDSLGGNSQTLMIACVSPCDRDFMETLNTLKYANRARNIKNKVQLNQDQSSRTISQLRREIAALQMELLEFKQGKRTTDSEGNDHISDTCNENAMLLADNKRLQQRIKAMEETISVLTDSNSSLKLDKETHGWSSSTESSSDRSVTNMIAGYISEIEKLQAKLIESEAMYQNVKRKAAADASNKLRSFMKNNGSGDNADPDELINLAKREVEKEREMLMSRSLPGLQEDVNNLNNTSLPSNESCESDTDTESDDKTNEMQEDLNDINSDIEIKTKLIEQLELSQQRMQVMRQHYEDKLSVLNSKIMNTQKERDEVLANIGPSPANQPNDKAKKVKEEYERKLSDMQREMKKLQQAQREHIRQQRELQAQEAKLRNLRNELAELKCIKTRLIRKMTEQTNRHKEVDQRKAREIATLRKEQRRQQNTVKTLQAQMHAKEQILKRKTEEVTALRRNARGSTLSQRASGRVPPAKRDSQTFNSRLARQRWDNLSRAIARASRNKQAVLQLEKELERLMTERETLCRDLATLHKRQREAPCIELANEEDTIKSNLNYVQENIAQVQHAIMEFEEGKEASNDLQCLQVIIGNVNNVDEARFLLEHLTNSAITYSCTSALTQNRLVEHESMLKEVQQESGIQQQLLQHFLAQNNAVQISDLFASLNLDSKLNANNLSGSQKSLNSNGTYDIPADSELTGYVTKQRLSISRSPSPTPAVDFSSYDKNAKVRRRTAQPQDLLFGDSEVSHNGMDDAMTRSYTQQETMSRSFHPLMRVPSAPGSLKESLHSPSLTKKNIETSLLAAASTQPQQSPRLARRGLPNKGSPGFDDDATMMVPQSPPIYRKMISRDENNSNNSSSNNGGGSDVFSRLGAGTLDPPPGGSIQKVTGKIRVGAPLYCTHTVSGHNNSVLSIKVDDDILYTAAADRTVKVWDLSRETAQHCLSTHPGPVIAVQNDKATRLLFSASGPFVRVWDLRSSNTKAIKTLTSSGQVLAGNASVTGVVPGESPITALCMGTSGNLYVAASDKVRIWDLKNLCCVGKLSGGHQAAVMCVTAWEGDGDGNTDFVATGSKDHYVKVFEVPKSGGVVYPLLNLEPPHYDGVQALAVAQDAVGADAELFSGSRDSGIKRWDLKSGELKQSLNNAHKGWVSGMAISGDVLLSSCRGGIIRLWNVKSCESLAEMKTDLMINDIVASSQRVFTASSDGKVRMWRFTNTLRRQCSLDNNSS